MRDLFRGESDVIGGSAKERRDEEEAARERKRDQNEVGRLLDGADARPGNVPDAQTPDDQIGRGIETGGDDEFSLDMGSAKIYDRMPEGWHRAIIRSATFAHAHTGTRQLQIAWGFDGQGGDGTGLTEYVPITQASAWRLKRILKALGVGDDLLRGRIDVRDVSEQIVNRRCEVRVRENPETLYSEVIDQRPLQV